MPISDDQPVSVGNLKALFAKDGGGGLINSMYPVGSIYMSVNAANPSTLFGGTWQRIQGRFLFAADSAHAAGTTGGEETHKLTVEEMPRHSHSIKGYSFRDLDSSTISLGKIENSKYQNTESAGEDKPHNNMPPYLSVYIWKRTA